MTKVEDFEGGRTGYGMNGRQVLQELRPTVLGLTLDCFKGMYVETVLENRSKDGELEN